MTIDHDRMRQVADAYAAAWNSGSAEAVARFHAPDGGIVINRGRLWEGRTGLAEMAAGFFADVPDLALVCDGLRIAGDHVAYLWTFTGTAATTGNALRIPGWESGTSTRSTWSGRPEAGSTRLTTRARSGDHPHRAARRTQRRHDEVVRQAGAGRVVLAVAAGVLSETAAGGLSHLPDPAARAASS